MTMITYSRFARKADEDIYSSFVYIGILLTADIIVVSFLLSIIVDVKVVDL